MESSEPATPPQPDSPAPRLRAAGKFLFAGDQKVYLRGVTYGPFRPDQNGCEYRNGGTLAGHFARMVSCGINSIRTYTVPPRWLLDSAQRHGLRVLVGLPWEQHVAFLEDPRLATRIERNVRQGVRACAGHPAILGYAIGNEIPAGIVRWHGAPRVEEFIRRLWEAAKKEDPEALVTYANYPSTEYLELPFVDFHCYNVYLESPRSFEAYLARLQNLVGDKPLVLGEIGFDSYRNGEQAQATLLTRQLLASFAAGCAGTFLFGWTDEWHRGGHDILDWGFGLTRRDGSSKPALARLEQTATDLPFPPGLSWPRISVVVCTYNGVSTLDECLQGLSSLRYPRFEVILVNDGSVDAVARIAKRYRVRLLNIPRSGLSAARNAGLAAATGEIVAYIDDDARPDPHWLHYLGYTFLTSDFTAVGGPNIPPGQNSLAAECIAKAPGGPVHVLVSDREAEHIPGCNMAFRKRALEEIGGFDSQFHVAGDDVDVCWRVEAAGGKIGFHAGAMVWHHRRQTVRAYWKQQVGYGRAEALLERKWPQKYNNAGHLAWNGRIYGNGRMSFFRKGRIYHGVWGSSLFQSVYEPAPNTFWSTSQMPEWYLVVCLLAAVAALGLSWRPLLAALPLLAFAVGAPAVQAALQVRSSGIKGARKNLLLWYLHILQPLARLYGRLDSGLTPWRQRRLRGAALPGLRHVAIWSTRWRSVQDWIMAVEGLLQADGAMVRRGGEFDRWDLEVWGGPLGAIRARLLVEEHGGGKQLMRVRAWPRWVWFGALCGIICGGLALQAWLDRAWTASGFLGCTSLFCVIAILDEWSVATAALLRQLKSLKETVATESTAELDEDKFELQTPAAAHAHP